MLRTASFSLVIATLWFLLSGHTSAFILALGAVSVVVVVLIAHRMDVVDHEGYPLHLSRRAPGYWLWLLWEILKSNWAVVKAVMAPRGRIDPHVLDVVATQRSEVGQVTYANSITLTPGTITIAANPGRLRVHALTKATAEDLLDGEMDRRVSAMEGYVPEGERER